MTARARVVRAADAAAAKPLFTAGPSRPQWRRIAREQIEGKLCAERILQEARAEADSWLSQARAEAAKAAAIIKSEAREQAQADLAARWLALRHEEHKRIVSDAERAIALAVALSERLLGTALALDPTRVVGLARTVIAEARGARRAVVDAHPGDAATLREHLTLAGLDVQTVEVRDDAALARGELRLHTDVGTIDARLAPRFERLAAALHDALK
jgi:flagellar biosynthesis/type III secretory pathway protein FliH